MILHDALAPDTGNRFEPFTPPQNGYPSDRKN